jgi:hypothetical protein
VLTTLLVIGGVLVGLVVLLALIVGLSGRPAARRGSKPRSDVPGWVADTGRRHPDAWTPPTSELPAAR